MKQDASYTLIPIGWVRSERAVLADDHWDSVACAVELDSRQFDASALHGLDAFSHVEVLYLLDQVPDETIERAARHPRGNANWPKVGIFAQRGSSRPNRLAATICSISAVTGTRLELTGLDAVDGTPVVDIKPVMRGFLPRGSLREPAWAVEIMREYW